MSLCHTHVHENVLGVLPPGVTVSTPGQVLPHGFHNGQILHGVFLFAFIMIMSLCLYVLDNNSFDEFFFLRLIASLRETPPVCSRKKEGGHADANFTYYPFTFFHTVQHQGNA